MGMAVGGANRGTFVEVNVVPLIDILLVLLVIFMIIPHHQTGLRAELPQPSSSDLSPAPRPEVIVVQVFADGSLRINQQPVPWDQLGSRLEEIFKSRASRVAFIRGDGALEFQVVARVVDIMQTAGVVTVGLMTPGLDKAIESD